MNCWAQPWINKIEGRVASPTEVYAMRVPSDDVVYEVDIVIGTSDPEKGEGKR
jgi:hypothetical protein